MDISGINPAQKAPKLDVETRASAAREIQLKAADHVLTDTDTADQMTTARALAGEKKVGGSTEASDEKVKREESRKAKLSSELSYKLTSEAIQTKTPRDNTEF